MVQRILLVIILILPAFLIADRIDAETLESLRKATEASKENIVEHLNQELMIKRLEGPFIDIKDDTYSFVDIYRHAYHAVGLQDPVMSFSKLGFSSVPSIWSSPYRLNLYDTFYDQTVLDRSLNFTPSRYPYEVMATDIQAGLGDYEFNFAKGRLRKQKMLGLDGLYYNMDFLAQTGYWTSLAHPQSSHKHYLKYEHDLFSLDLEYFDYAQDNSSQELLPLYWIPANQRIDYRKRDFYFGVKSPILDFALLHEKELLEVPEIENESMHYRLSKDLESNRFKLKLGWERLDSDLQYTALNTATERLFTDKLFLNADYFTPLGFIPWSVLITSVDLNYYDFDDFRLESSLDLAKHDFDAGDTFSLGLYYLESGVRADTEQVIDIFNPGSFMDTAHQVVRRDLAARISWLNIRQLDITLQGGLREYDKKGAYLGNSYESTARLPYLDLLFRASRSFGLFDLKLSQSFRYHSEDDATVLLEKLTEIPRFRSQTHLRLSRDMGNNNSIFGGLSLQAHDLYYSARALPTEIGASSILDLWAGVSITKSFELTLAFKNALDTDIYGTYPLPQSVHANLHWYFLN